MNRTQRGLPGEGTIFQLTDGRWQARVAYRIVEAGTIKRRYLSRTTQNRDDAAALLPELRDRAAGKAPPYPMREEDLANEAWLLDMRITLAMWTDQWAGDPKMADALTEALRLLNACPVEVE